MSRFLCAALLLAVAPIADAATFAVTRFDDPAPNGCFVNDCSLREAVIAANVTSTLDTIQLGSGTYSLTRGCTTDTPSCNDLDVTRPLKIIGQSATATVIVNAVPWFALPWQPPAQADRLHTRVVDLSATEVTLEKLALRDGMLQGSTAGAALGGCLRATSTAVVLTDVHISGCDAGSVSSGGGMAVDGGVLTLSKVRIADNTAVNGGGIHSSKVRITGSDVEIADNVASSYGGGVYLFGGQLNLGGASHIVRNSADSGGGIVANHFATMIIGGSAATLADRLAIEDNTSANSGGGIEVIGINPFSNTAPLTIRNLVLRRNLAANDGGGVYIALNGGAGADPVLISDAEFHANEAGGSGGGLHLDTPKTGGDSVSQRLSFWQNTANERGGAIFHVGGSALRHVSSTSNSAGIEGNSLYVVASSPGTPNLATPRIEFLTTTDEGPSSLVFGRPAEISASALDAGCVGPVIDLGANIRRDDMSGCPGVAVPSGQMGLGFGYHGGSQRVVGIVTVSSVLRNGALNYPGTRDARGYVRQGLADIGAYEYDGTP